MKITRYVINDNLTILTGFPEEIKGNLINFSKNNIKEEELLNFNYDISSICFILSDFNKGDNKREFVKKIDYYKNIDKENELLKELSVNSNSIKLNKKL